MNTSNGITIQCKCNISIIILRGINMKKILGLGLTSLMTVTLLSGCTPPKEEAVAPSTGLKDGAYHAEYDRKDVRNWTAFVDITVKDGKITEAYYDYTNEKKEMRTKSQGYIDGFSKANGFTPREGFDKLGANLIKNQDAAKVDVVTGATHSSRNFNELAAAAIEKAKAGDTTAAIVPLYEDGKYKVEADKFDDHGWKPFVELEIKDHKIATVNFDYINEAGKLKSEDAEYKANMEPVAKTYPGKYLPELEKALVDKQLIGDVEAVSGATHSSDNFKALVEYALDDLAEVGKTGTASMSMTEE
jgi:major membrane immunogen (membrane-anchored lipoprotein)